MVLKRFPVLFSVCRPKCTICRPTVNIPANIFAYEVHRNLYGMNSMHFSLLLSFLVPFIGNKKSNNNN